MLKRPAIVLLAAFVACGAPAQTPAPKPPTPAPAIAPMPSVAPAPPIEPDDRPLPLWPDIKYGKLPNGLTYYVLKHAKPKTRALLWMAIDAGSVQEDDDQRGLAHFVEHMAFNGTKRFPANDLIKYLESVGTRFGADLNAHTWWDETVYKLEVPTDKPELVTTGLDILRDWASNITFDPKEVDKERGVVLEEWRLGRGAGMRLFDKHAKVQYKGSRYADRITIGLPEIIKGAPRDTLVRYYKDWYRPELMAVFAVGDFDAAAIEAEIKKRFGDLAGPAKPRSRTRGGVPTASGTRVSIETDREATGTSVTIANQIAKRSEASKRDFRRMLSENLYTSILSDRLSSLARKPNAPFMNAYASIGTSGGVRDVDAFTRGASAKDGKLEDALRLVLTEVVRIEKHGITATELERARINAVRRYEQMAETMATRESRSLVEEMIRNFYEGELMLGSAREKEIALEMLPTLTIADLERVGAAFGGEQNRVVVISAPEGKKLPGAARVLEIVNEVTKTTVTPWQDKVPTSGLMAKTPAPGKIKKESKIEKIGVTEWTLSNGVRVIVKPTDFEIDSVQISGSSPGGLAIASDKDYPVVRWASSIVGVGGVGEHDVETLDKVLTGKQARASTSIGETTESVSAGGSVKDIETILQLVHLRMTAPRKDDDAIAVWRANQREQLTNQQRSPDYRFGRDSQNALWKNHLRRKWSEPADLDKIDVNKAIAFYKNRFGDASDFTFVIVGAVELDKLRPLVETYLASLPAKGRKEKEKDLKIRKAAGVVKKTYQVGSEPKARVSIQMHGPYKWTRDHDRDMYILGQAMMQRLREVMREDKGGVYGVGAFGSLSRVPDQERSFSVSFGCDPARVNELVTTVFAEAERMTKDDFPVADLDRIKQTFLRAREVELRQNRFWVSWLSSAYRHGDDPTIVLDTEAVTKRMTPAMVKASAKRYLATKQYYQAVMLPEPSSAPTK